MPTYEYRCAACGSEWEEIQKITEAPIEQCPNCKMAAARRQISGGNFILKGGGWYSDLYSSAKPSTKKEGESGGSSSDTSKPAAETPAKAPDAKAPEKKAEGKAAAA
jgi:putative FmdB family regulatory protein